MCCCSSCTRRENINKLWAELIMSCEVGGIVHPVHKPKNYEDFSNTVQALRLDAEHTVKKFTDIENRVDKLAEEESK